MTKRPTKGKPNPVDVHVGQRLRLRRTILGLSQEKLGEGLGLTFQQIQKYERGTNRIGASRLYDLGRVLSVPVAYFFEGMDEDTRQSSPGLIAAGDAPDELPELKRDEILRRRTIELARHLEKMPQSVQKRLVDLARAMASSFGRCAVEGEGGSDG